MYLIIPLNNNTKILLNEYLYRNYIKTIYDEYDYSIYKELQKVSCACVMVKMDNIG